MNGIRLFTAILLGFAATGCQHHQSQPYQSADPAAEEAGIRKSDAAWLSAATAHDLEKTLPFWADDATIMPSGVPAVVGQLAIRQYVAGAFATPGFSISWNTDQIVVSKSGDMAFSTGTNQISLPGPDGKPVVSENRTVVIWKKQSDGSWKCLLDVFTPAPAATSK